MNPIHRIPVKTIIRLNNYELLYTGDYKTLDIGPYDDLTRLPERYRELIYGLYKLPGEADRMWAALLRLSGEQMTRIPENGMAQDLAWLVGQRETGGYQFEEARAWQKRHLPERGSRRSEARLNKAI